MAMLNANNKFISDAEFLSSISNQTKFLGEASISDNAKLIIDLCRKK